ncbi:MAG: phage tail assembly protein [Candidatus Methanoperedens sp.]|nr:phage tail assembly protein [Candidatus Methanoperedens sp.]MCZ7404395.1 phage tail assembly protein [Candidatus Methanoperedens sp.]
MGILQTEHEFTLPMGYVDEAGTLHRDGKMRLATAADEILPMKDPRVQSNPAYLTVILLSRVVTSLGSLKMVNPKVVEGLFAGDFAYLQEMYTRINQNGSNVIKAVCPKCEHKFDIEVQSLGE